jgi:hypothetical protein
MTCSCYDISYLTFNNNYSFTILQADIKPETDGCNGLKYNLTTDIIESIFRTYPMGQYLFLISFKADIIIEFLFRLFPMGLYFTADIIESIFRTYPIGQYLFLKEQILKVKVK